ncbi:hypothetical protein AKJ41_00010 [candidate division MSBL1 archaeon SCGC-AAA259O05]|uniref:GTPase n=1 Tax=candidate division MSBL1 archaeon SCGC-AAA259O05 TaxID=1698271 RepID=A0A133V5S8_9EURY|nr:hypothetical protein AKJ41_00010 [candidate division MSBL1 archaeon SCGC-AAA259O05]
MNVLVVGPAGSGKSLFTREFGRYLMDDFSVVRVNLDSGVGYLPYRPDFDVREYFSLEEIMSEKDLGPNGATLEAVDRLKELDIPNFSEDFVLMDTPGQLEPFVFRGGASAFADMADLTVYLVDSTGPVETFPSQYLYSLASQYSLNTPMVRALNKLDLIDRERAKELEEMMMDPRMFANLEDVSMRSQMNMDIANLLMQMYSPSRFPAISAKTREGFEDVLTYILETLSRKRIWN